MGQVSRLMEFHVTAFRWYVGMALEELNLKSSALTHSRLGIGKADSRFSVTGSTFLECTRYLSLPYSQSYHEMVSILQKD